LHIFHFLISLAMEILGKSIITLSNTLRDSNKRKLGFIRLKFEFIDLSFYNIYVY
jgi:hypothetical protein